MRESQVHAYAAEICHALSGLMLIRLWGCALLGVQGLRDPHARVRWAACQAVGQLCTDLGPDLQEAEHGRLLPGLMAAMDDFAQPRVQAHAAAALVNFSENCEQVRGSGWRAAPPPGGVVMEPPSRLGGLFGVTARPAQAQAEARQACRRGPPGPCLGG